MSEAGPWFRRDYDGAMGALRARLGGGEQTREARMRVVVDVLWERFGGEGDGRGVSWVGFYLPVYDEAGAPVEMVLGPRRDKPACSPIGLHGACGRAFLSRTALVITDVANLGEAYVACDPRDRSELVIPCLNETDACWAVLDFDSYEAGAFVASDVVPILDLLQESSLPARRSVSSEII